MHTVCIAGSEGVCGHGCAGAAPGGAAALRTGPAQHRAGPCTLPPLRVCTHTLSVCTCPLPVCTLAPFSCADSRAFGVHTLLLVQRARSSLPVCTLCIPVRVHTPS
eukprot:489105-Rhodomonas_salina.2